VIKKRACCRKYLKNRVYLSHWEGLSQSYPHAHSLDPYDFRIGPLLRIGAFLGRRWNAGKRHKVDFAPWGPSCAVIAWTRAAVRPRDGRRGWGGGQNRARWPGCPRKIFVNFTGLLARNSRTSTRSRGLLTRGRARGDQRKGPPERPVVPKASRAFALYCQLAQTDWLAACWVDARFTLAFGPRPHDAGLSDTGPVGHWSLVGTGRFGARRCRLWMVRETTPSTDKHPTPNQMRSPDETHGSFLKFAGRS